MKLNTYLNFDGNCEEAFKFYAQLLNGKIEALMRFSDMPGDCGPMPEADRQRIMHACLSVDGQWLMGTDCTSGQPYAPIKCAYVVINLEDAAEAERLFAALAEGGKIEMPIQQTFWALRYGIAVDRFGVPWMINCIAPQQGEGCG